MNPLTHAQFSIDWIQQNQYRGNKHLLLLGSVLPDLAYMGFIPEHEAHKNSTAFLNYLKRADPTHIALGVGFMLHGEEPHCLDYYTHKKKGYIAQKANTITDLMRKAKLKLGKWYPRNEDDFTHSVIEFSGDTLIQKETTQQLQQALHTINLPKVAFHLSNFFKGDSKRILRALQYFKTFDFTKLQHPKGVARTIQDFSILQAFSHHNNTMERYNAILNRMNFWRTHKLVQLLHQARDIINEDYHEFLANVQDKVNKKTTNTIYTTI